MEKLLKLVGFIHWLIHEQNLKYIFIFLCLDLRALNLEIKPLRCRMISIEDYAKQLLVCTLYVFLQNVYTFLDINI
jgi:hypothetical protein